jgi:vacuolar protein sorting-associated protein 26
MEILLLTKETVGSGSISDENAKLETTQLGRVEIMDGFPAKGETVPVRIFLAQFADTLTPSMHHVNNQFSVANFLSIVLIDETGRRYFREHEIQIYQRDL